MAVEVGTDVFDTVASVDAYHAARGNTEWGALELSEKEVAMRGAADWLERNFTWRGVRKTASQRLGWPRTGAWDDDGFSIGETEAPWQVKEAQAVVADIVRKGEVDLDGIVTAEARVKRTKVDVIEVEYDLDTTEHLKGQAVLSHVILLLAPVTVNRDTLLRS